MAERSQTVASGSDGFAEWSFDPCVAENCRELPPAPASVATVATVAAPNPNFPWAAGLAHFMEMPAHPRVAPEKWDELINEADSVSRQWGQKAVDCNWAPLDLFGSNPDPFVRRYDRKGLVQTIVDFMTPLQIVELTPDFAALRDPNGAILRFRTGWRKGQVYLWEAYNMGGGP